MSELDNDLTPEVSELDALKARADLLGISYHPSIGLEKLRDKVNAAVQAPTEAAAPAAPVESERSRLQREASALVRVNITCMNPAKKEWEGEIFTVGNSVVGTFKKYVPFNTTEGWHVPQIILEQIRARECQVFVSTKDSRGNSVRKGKLIREFSVEVLDALTPEEIKDLAQRQAMAGSVG